MAVVYGPPFISGKDSLYNEFETGKESICIPHTLLISAIAVMDDIHKSVSMDGKKPGDLIYIIGETFNELGGSHYFSVHGLVGNSVPKVNPEKGKKLMAALSAATNKGLVRACHDLSEGGLGVAAAEMAFAGGVGLTVSLESVPLGEPVSRDDYILFSESNSRFLAEVAPENKAKFEKALAGIAFAQIGKVTASKRFEVSGNSGKMLVSAPIAALKEAWQKPLRW